MGCEEKKPAQGFARGEAEGSASAARGGVDVPQVPLLLLESLEEPELELVDVARRPLEWLRSSARFSSEGRSRTDGQAREMPRWTPCETPCESERAMPRSFFGVWTSRVCGAGERQGAFERAEEDRVDCGKCFGTEGEGGVTRIRLIDKRRGSEKGWATAHARHVPG
eukprot:6173687-Pleurochrysis_carterae.AAC.2